MLFQTKIIITMAEASVYTHVEGTLTQEISKILSTNSTWMNALR